MKRALMLVLVVALAIPAFAQTPRDRGGESGSSTRQYSDSFLLLFPQGKAADGVEYKVRLSLFSVGSRGSSILLGAREASSAALVPADGVANIEFASSTESLSFSFLRVKSEELGSEIVGQAEILAGDAVSATVGLVESSRRATTLAEDSTWIAIANPGADTATVEATLYFDYSGSPPRGWRTSGSDTVILQIGAGGWRGGFVAEFFELQGRVPKKLEVRCVTPVAFDAFSVGGEVVSQQAVYREK